MYINTKNEFQFHSEIPSITMQTLGPVLVASFALCAYALPPFSPRVVGGQSALAGKHLHFVTLRYNGHIFCGGSIINKRYILTAAHCLAGMSAEERKYIVISAGSIAYEDVGTIYKPEKMIEHEHFNMFEVNDDIGLIRVGKDIEFTDKVQPIGLVESDPVDGHPARLAGFGRLKAGGAQPKTLQEIDLLIISQKKCAASSWRVKETNICTFTKSGEGACHGDSGGPLVADGKQVGIVSFGEPCAIGHPDIYTRVSSYKDWIEQNMEPF